MAQQDIRPESLLAQNARQILSAALETQHGIVVRCETFGDLPNITLRAKQVLYRFKKENSDFKALRVFFDPDEPTTKIWVVKDPTISTDVDINDLEL